MQQNILAAIGVKAKLLKFTGSGHKHMRFKFSYIYLPIALSLIFFTLSCKKDKILTSGGQLRFSVDTLTFDTVFTAAGSFTASVKIYNPQDQEVSISSVRMANGAASYFHLNVDGVKGGIVNNVTIRAHDSIYVFALVNIDPTNDSTPFVIDDKLVATLNGKDFSLPFMAYGQNAYYIVDSVMNSQIWKTDKPYVVVHSAEVAQGQTLTIPAGCRVYMHQDSRLVVLGTLKATGTKTDSIIFQGDRLDRFYFGYQGYPGEWGGIYYGPYSTGNILSHVWIENAGNSALGAFPAAVEVYEDSLHSGTQLKMDHVIIRNSLGYGIISFGGTIHAENCLVNTCGSEALALVQGGNDSFYNCSFVCYGTDKISHTQYPTAVILNYFYTDDTHYLVGNTNAWIQNCVFWGGLDTEMVCDKKPSAAYNVVFDHCIVKAGTTSINAAGVTTSACIFNQDPVFKNITTWDFHASTASSPMVNNGASLLFIVDDLGGQSRPLGGKYDIGCYESY